MSINISDCSSLDLNCLDGEKCNSSYVKKDNFYITEEIVRDLAKIQIIFPRNFQGKKLYF